jgi:hypothetical protein
VRRRAHESPPIADWTDATQYPEPDAYNRVDTADDPYYTSKLWAWQFLRRNVEYRQVTDAIFRDQIFRNGPEFEPRFGLSFIIPYKEEIPEIIPFVNSFALRATTLSAPKETVPLQDQQVAITFDLSRPIRQQLRLAHDYLKEQRQRRSQPGEGLIPKRKHIEAYPRYLRILDALHVGTTSRKIAERFILERLYRRRPERAFRWFEGEDLIERDIRSAKRLTSKDYMRIAYT